MNQTQAVSCHTGKVGFRKVQRLSEFIRLRGEVQTEFPGWDTDLHPYPHCGTVRYPIRCSDGQEGHQVRLRKNHCDSKDCPVCYPTWSYRRGKRAAERIFSCFNDDHPRWSGNPSNLYEFMFSAPPEWDHLPYQEQIKRLVKVAKDAGLRGGGYVAHPARFIDYEGNKVRWKQCSLNRYPDKRYPVIDSMAVPGTHIHGVGWGRLEDSPIVEAKTGVMYKKQHAGQVICEDAIGRMFTYFLTHTNVSVSENGKARHAIRYLGLCSCNKYQVVYVEQWYELVLCDVCGAPMEYYHEPSETWLPYSISITRRHFKFKDQAIPYDPQRTLEVTSQPNIP